MAAGVGVEADLGEPREGVAVSQVPPDIMALRWRLLTEDTTATILTLVITIPTLTPEPDTERRWLLARPHAEAREAEAAVAVGALTELKFRMYLLIYVKTFVLFFPA